VVDEVGGQEGFGRLDGRDAVPAQLGDEAVWQGFPAALDAALGLGRVGADEADREVSQDLAELGGCWAPCSSSSTLQWASLRTKTPRRSP
jgi:hypothetical protein